jgi:hypothetical protein
MVAANDVGRDDEREFSKLPEPSRTRSPTDVALTPLSNQLLRGNRAWYRFPFPEKNTPSV